MKLSAAPFAVVAMTLLAGCAGAPTAPSVMVLPGDGKTFEQFHADDLGCRQSAAQDAEQTPRGGVPAQRRYDMVYMQCMYGKGHQIPIPGGRQSYTPPLGAAPTTAPPNVPAPGGGTPTPPAPAPPR